MPPISDIRTRFLERIDHRSSLYRAEARDFARRLRAVLRLDGLRVLDFGCGAGLVAVELAPQAAEVALWDHSPLMRQRALATVASCANVALIDLDASVPARRFDLIVMNSVVQYLDDATLAQELKRSSDALAAGGTIVISDVPTPARSLASEVGELLSFAARERILLDVLAEQLRLARDYGAIRRSLRLREAADLERLARGAGLRIGVLPENLTHRRHRMSVCLRRDATEAP